MRIGELSARTGISDRMLRYYEQQGLLVPARDDNGYRNYTAGDLETAARIAALASAGLPIEHIRVVAPCMSRSDEEPHIQPCPGVVDSLRQRLSDLDARIASLTASRQAVAAQLASVAADQDSTSESDAEPEGAAR